MSVRVYASTVCLVRVIPAVVGAVTEPEWTDALGGVGALYQVPGGAVSANRTVHSSCAAIQTFIVLSLQVPTG